MTDIPDPIDPRVRALVRKHASRARNHAVVGAVLLMLLIIGGSLYAGALWAQAQVDAAWQRVRELEAFQELKDRAQALVATVRDKRDEIETALEDVRARRDEIREAAKEAVKEAAAVQGGLIPDGVVLPWLGDDPPHGWVVCDGTNGTPKMVGLSTEGEEGWQLRFMMRER